MGFKSLIEKQVQGAMRILGTDDDGLARSQTYIAVGEATYDAATRRAIAAEVEHEGVPMALVRFSIKDMDEEVRPKTDRVALISTLDLPGPPSENDKIKTHDGIEYTVMRIMSDPADALSKLHIRRQ
ncbi:hypothetical protein [Phaeobacter phage MD18]|nr:hypothetical protein [Phaeobacter phage MD18]